MKEFKKGLFYFLFSLCVTLLSGCGDVNDEDSILRECSNEMSAFSALNYIRTTTLLSQQSTMNEKDAMSFKILSGSSTCEDDPSEEGKGRVFLTYQYTMQGEIIKTSESFDVLDFGNVKEIGMENTVIFNSKSEIQCPNVSKNDSRYVNVKLVNKTYKNYIKTGKLNIEKANFTVQFFNDGQLLEVKTTGWRGEVAYTGDVPTKEGNAQYSYQFTHWDHALTNITSDLNVHAQFSSSINHYIVTFQNYDGKIIETKEYAYGEMPSYEGETPQRGSDGRFTYEFKGWDAEMERVTGDQVYTAQYEAIRRDIYYEVANGTAYVMGYNEKSSHITIPSTVNIGFKDYSVTCIAINSFEYSPLVSITIPSSVTIIAEKAFHQCTSLKSVVFEKDSKLNYIGNSAFEGCSSLSSITLPSTLSKIGFEVFFNCSSLVIFCEVSSKPSEWSGGWNCSRPVYWGAREDNTHYQGGLYFWIANGNATVVGHESNITNVIIPAMITIKGIRYNVTNIGDRLFENCSSLSSIEIPDSVTSIGNDAFSGCSSLSSIEIPNSVTSIGVGAFFGCNSLTSFVIPNGVTRIEDSVFSGCSSLSSIEIPNSVMSIGIEAFSDCSSLTSIKIPDNVESIEYSVFSRCTSLTSVVIPNSVTSIKNFAFSQCSSLTSIIIPNSVTSIGYEVFYRCKSLTAVTFEEGSKLVSLGFGSFSECSSLTSFIIPYGVTQIERSMFDGCTSLTSIEIPSSVTIIGDNAFSYCSSLTSIVIPNSVTIIGDDAFENCSSLTSIEIPNSVKTIRQGAFSGCSSLTSITFDGESKLTCVEYKTFLSCKSLTSIVIPYGVTSIGRYAFSDCKSLISIEIPNSVTSIGHDAFYNCSSLQYNEYGNGLYLGNEENPYLVLVKAKDKSITEATIHENTKIIMDSAFAECKSLTSIIFEEGCKLTSIDDYTFYNCDSLVSIEIPDSIKSIGDSAFSGCTHLTSVTFEDGSTLSSIGREAFRGCIYLTSIVIPICVTSMENSVFHRCSSLTVFCEADSKPSGWDSGWYDYDIPVYWAGEWSYVNGVPTPNHN